MCERRAGGGERVVPEAGLEPRYPTRLSFPLPSSAASALSLHVRPMRMRLEAFYGKNSCFYKQQTGKVSLR